HLPPPVVLDGSEVCFSVVTIRVRMEGIGAVHCHSSGVCACVCVCVCVCVWSHSKSSLQTKGHTHTTLTGIRPHPHHDPVIRPHPHTRPWRCLEDNHSWMVRERYQGTVGQNEGRRFAVPTCGMRGVSVYGVCMCVDMCIVMYVWMCVCVMWVCVCIRIGACTSEDTLN
ncbi:hypothetical protein EMCRGX_G003726, partial [Ephydatia muelleri]